MATLLKPLHELLCDGKRWKWTEECDRAFKQAKAALTDSGVLTHFNPSLPIQLACDASPYGVGAVLSHIIPSGEDKPVAFASRTLSHAEIKYPQTEKEALGIVFGIKKFHLFGRRFVLLTDHWSLTSIFGPHTGIPSLAASRLQRWALILSAHNYEIKYRRSEAHANADGLSRLPLPEHPSRAVRQQDIFYFSMVDNAPVTAHQLKRETRVDPVLSQVLDRVMRGDVHCTADVTSDLRPYLMRGKELTVVAGCLLWGMRVIIPEKLRPLVLDELHSGHSGIVRMKELARSYFWWPGVDQEIDMKTKSCDQCQSIRNAPCLAPLHPWEWPAFPWQSVHLDFAGPVEGRMLLVAVDAHSKWPEVAVMSTTTSEKTIEALREMFSRYGLPEQMVTDNGPQFTSQEMRDFLRTNVVKHILSSPYHPATNGLAERMVQTVKHSLKATKGKSTFEKRLAVFLLQYRNTPHATTKASSAFLFMKRLLRTRLDLLRPQPTHSFVQSKQQGQISLRAKGAKDRQFSNGDAVLARNYSGHEKWVLATITQKTGPVSYTVETHDNQTWRQHLDQLLFRGVPKGDPGGGQEVTDACTSEDFATHMPRTPVLAPSGVANDSSMATSLEQPPSTETVPVLRRNPYRERKPPERLSM